MKQEKIKKKKIVAYAVMELPNEIQAIRFAWGRYWKRYSIFPTKQEAKFWVGSGGEKIKKIIITL